MTWSGAFPDGKGRLSFLSSRSSLYPNSRKTVHVVSRRPFSINKAWRYRNPFRVRPRRLTPSGIFSRTTLLTSTISEGWRGALKHLTYQKANISLCHIQYNIIASLNWKYRRKEKSGTLQIRKKVKDFSHKGTVSVILFI